MIEPRQVQALPHAWQQLYAEVNTGVVFDGTPGVRDVLAPCDAFQPGKPSGGCSTDGHYLCDECVERATCEGCGNRPMSCECQEVPHG